MKLYDKIKLLLIEQEELRSSDKKLIWELMEMEGIIYISDGKDSIDKQKFLNGVAFESMTRARRKIQENYPELQANETVRKFREKIRKQKGTHIYRETLKTGSYEMVIGKDNIARRLNK